MIDPALAGNVRDDAASRIAALGYDSVRCRSCGRVLSLSEDQMGMSLRNGWPECCGYTMELVRKEAP